MPVHSGSASIYHSAGDAAKFCVDMGVDKHPGEDYLSSGVGVTLKLHMDLRIWLWVKTNGTIFG